MSESMQAKLVNDGLLMAIWKRKPDKGLIWHTDQGSQYASDSHRTLLREHGIIQSMSRKGNCWDNSVAESFFHTLKTEQVHHQRYQTREEAQQDIFEYIEVFITENGFIQPITIYHQWTTKYSKKLLNCVSGKVLTHHFQRLPCWPAIKLTT